MKINSLLPPVSFQSVTDGKFYIVTTDKKLGWVEVDRKYSWEELEKMWVRPKSNFVKNKPIKSKSYSVVGSSGKIYKVVNNRSSWNCSCPAFGWGRGKECKHIKSVKNEK